MWKNETNNLQIVFTNSVDAEVGDFVKIKGDSVRIYYSKVMRVVSTDLCIALLDKVITENGHYILGTDY